MIPSPTEIDYFIEIYQTRHISKAALRLGVSQPTLTQSLQRLESKLGTLLFHRTKQGVVPTPNAALFYQHAQSLRDCWAEIQSGVFDGDHEIEGSFVIGCHQSVGAYTLPTLVERLASEAPKINIKLVHDFSRKITEGIVSYQVDLGYVVNPPRHPDLVLKKIGNDQICFWKKRGQTSVPKVIFADASRDQVEELLGKAKGQYFSGWSLVPSTSFELIRTLTHQGLGVGILPERVAKADGADLMIYDKQLPIYHDQIYLAFRKEVLKSKAGQELLRLATFKLV